MNADLISSNAAIKGMLLRQDRPRGFAFEELVSLYLYLLQSPAIAAWQS
jgi:hypothetical protein